MTPPSDGSSSGITEAERAHVASCLAASGLLVAPSQIAGVESDGFCVVFAGADGGCVWVRPSTRRAIREGMRKRDDSDPSAYPCGIADHTRNGR